MSFIQWILAHQFVLGCICIAILDAAFALSPKLAASGILHQIYLWLKAIKAPANPPQ